MICKYCEKIIKDDSIYCPYCGKQLNQEVFGLKNFPGAIISALPINSQEDLDEAISIGKKVLHLKIMKRLIFSLEKLLDSVMQNLHILQDYFYIMVMVSTKMRKGLLCSLCKLLKGDMY